MGFSLKQKKVYTMDSDVAGKTLQNILDACDKEPVQASLKELLDRPKPKTLFCNLGRCIAVIMLLLTFFAPLIFPHSPVNFDQSAGSVTELTLDSHYIMNGNLYLQFYGDSLNPDKCYMITDSGYHFTCTSYDKQKGLISFPYEGEGANIFIESSNGTVLQILMTLRND